VFRQVSLMCLVISVSGCIPHLYTTSGSDWDWEAPVNQWLMGSPPQGLVGTGFFEGQVVPDFFLEDQQGEWVSLWQFYGNIVVLDVSTMWCAPCQELAAGVVETSAHYGDEGFIYVTVLQETANGSPPETSDLAWWADTFGIGVGSPVLSDPDKLGTGSAIQQGEYPALLVIDREMTVIKRVDPPNDENLRDVIDELLN
jgi:thiol-disulfide isomerase/thioredoxin